MKDIITIESRDFSELSKALNEKRDSYARIIADYASEGKKDVAHFVRKYEAYSRLIDALINSEEVE